MTESVPLRFAGGTRMVRLGELTGRDEFAVDDVTTSNAIRLVAALLERGSAHSGESGSAEDLVAADRDRLLAAIYTRAFGDRIESTVTCGRCGQPFDVDFSLRKLLASVDERRTSSTVLENGHFASRDGVTFRLPTGRDELAVAGVPDDEAERLLFSRCVTAEDATPRAVLEELLDEVAPLLNIELVARCPECTHVQHVEFDIQTYVLGALAGERRRLIAEIHRIASAYGWPLHDILSLTRTDRRRFVEIIENESVRR